MTNLRFCKNIEERPVLGLKCSKYKKIPLTHIRGDGCRLPPEEILSCEPAAIFDLVDDDAFGTNAEDDLTV